MTRSYRNALAPHRLSPACAPRPEPQPGSVVITSTGTFDRTDTGFVRRTRASEITVAVEVSDPVVLGAPMPACAAGILLGAAVCGPILYFLGAF